MAMKVLVSGASGFVGSALMVALRQGGFEARELERGKSWEPDSGELRLDGWVPDGLVHLAGENIASRRWSAEQKRRIRSSRVDATEKMVPSLRNLKVFIGASATGYYGSRGDEILTEESGPGNDFLARVTQDWERASAPLADSGARVVHLRFGMILNRSGGALARMVPIFKAGVGGRVGSGKQWVSWVALDDVVRVIVWALTNSSARGAYNVVSPLPVTNAEFTRALGASVRRPAIFPVPATMLRLAFGEMADALLLSSQRVLPSRLEKEGFQFQVPKLEDALRR